MRPRISARVPARLHAQLTGAAGRSSASQSAIIVEALESFLADRPDAGRLAALERRLDRISRQLDRIERDGVVFEEVLSLFARAYMTWTPRLPTEAFAEARRLGADRWADFEDRLRASLANGRSGRFAALRAVMPDTLDAEDVIEEASFFGEAEK
ncbi:MAG: hypothetical protein PVI23_16805 [Maricaulaceae bacterium]|jgi:hypothetical protein